MYTVHEPVVGAWYVNKTGKVMKVKLVSYTHTFLSSVMIEYLDGTRQIVDIDAWYCLELNRDLQAAARNLALK